jgi:disulfide bond formation protein DsbB
MSTINIERTTVALTVSGKLKAKLIYLAWVQALTATLGSLFFSEILKLAPCVLCWYQRIAMYPLVVILTVGILLRDTRLKFYALPLSLTGLGISIYHNLLYYKFIPESIAPCTTGISCTTRQIEWLGFVTIPLMALIAFTVTSLSLLLYKPKPLDNENEDEDEEGTEEFYGSDQIQK